MLLTSAMDWKEQKCRVRVIFIGLKNMDAGWPHHLFDVDAEAERLKKELSRIEKQVENIEFYGWDIVVTEAEGQKLLPELEDADGILAIPLTQEFADGVMTPHPPLLQFADTGKPMIVYTMPFTRYWDQGGILERTGRVVVVNSSRIDDIIPPLKAMRAVARMKHIRILLVKDYEYPKEYIDPRLRDSRWMGSSFLKRIKEIFGVEIVRITSKELLEEYELVSTAEAEEIAKEVIGKSRGLREPSREEVVKASRMYLAIKRLLKKYGCNAFTIDCLTYVRARTLPVAPCLAISRLNDEEIPSACEADIFAHLTIIICHTLAERPVFMGDPVLDESENKVIIAHCTSPTKFTGYEDGQFPYWIRSHTESWREVGLEVEMKPSDVTVLMLLETCTLKAISFPFRVIDTKLGECNLLAVKTKLLGSMKHEWGCRTKAVIQLTEDPEEFKKNFTSEHKIVCYGDWVEQLRAVAKFLGLNFVNRLTLPLD